MLHKDFQPYLNMLIYPILFDQNPLESIDRVFHLIPLEQYGPAYIAAIEAALADSKLPSEVIPHEHSEATIRAYLQAILARLRLK